MYKKLYYLFFVIISVLFSSNNVFAEEISILNSDYEKTYIQYNHNLNKEKSAENYLNMCKITYLLNDKSVARLYCREALNYIEKEKTPDSELNSEIMSMMGDIYSTVYHNSDITFDYYNKAKVLKEKNPDTNKYNLAKLYRNISYAYNHNGNNGLSLDYLNKALDIVNNNDGIEFHSLASTIYRDFYLREKSAKNYDKAKNYLDLAIEAQNNSAEYLNHEMMAILYKDMANYYLSQKKDKKLAIQYYQKSVIENVQFPKFNDKKSENINESLSIDELKTELEEYPYDIVNNIVVGSSFLTVDNTNAEKYFKRALIVNSENPYVYIAIASEYAQKYSETGEKFYLGKAKEYIKFAESKSLYTPQIYLAIGTIYLKLKSIIYSNLYFDYYVKYSEDKAKAYCDIASVFWYFDSSLKYRNYVIHYIKKAEKINPNIDKIYKMMLIAAYRQLGNNKKADKLVKKLFS